MVSSKFEYGKKFEPSACDVIICTAPRTGTTWLQQVLHQLRTGGDDSFEDIYQVVPWIHMAWDLGQDLDMKRKGKPEDVFVSWYAFLKEHGAPVAVEQSLDDFILNERQNMRFGASLWEYYAEFVKCAALENVLVIIFEDMKDDLQSTVIRIARFIGIEQVSPKVMGEVLMRSSKQYMQQNKAFNESWTFKRLKSLQRCPQPESFIPVPKASCDHQARFSISSTRFLNETWKKIITEETGILDYQHLCHFIREQY
eukprot:CAMPEP_0194689476 /NCGR_PEP_ID=MMETSP0295-20121207/17641_1 /TAXON_ID=39354 /ORGANISM="Heterosigma akashiwo, Strain CCMP2393" /LENGTH=254 /DNA_ID=CAMNT_0039578539 /DNA_START=232 /DNA_END=998 /DNA_ORIENTATION=-